MCLWVLSPQAWGDEFDPVNPGDPQPYYMLRLETSPAGGGKLSFDHQMVEAGKNVTIEITPYTDFEFVQWVCGEDILSKYKKFTYTMPAKNVTLTAQMIYNEPEEPGPFNPANPGDPEGSEPAKPRHHVTIFTSPSVGGTVSKSNFYMREDTKQDLYAYNSTSYEFAGWYHNGELQSMNNPVTLTMKKEDISLTAKFRFNPLSPDDPGVNYLNLETGEMIIDHFTPGRLIDAIEALTDIYTRVLTITVVGQMNASDYGAMRKCLHAKSIDISRTSGYTAVPSSAFSGMSELEVVYLPATVEKIGNYAFQNCTSLKEIVLYAPVPPVKESGASVSYIFKNVPEGLAVRVPAQSLALYQESDLWKGFSLMPMELKALKAKLPKKDIELYKDMFLELLDTKSGQTRRYVVTDRDSYVFTNIFGETIYQLTLRNAQGTIFGQEMIEFKGEDIEVTFAELLKPAVVQAQILDKDGNDVTSATTITWYDVDGNYLSKGATLTAQMEKEVVLFSIELNDALGKWYIEPAERQQVFLQAGENIAGVTLTPIEYQTKNGRLLDDRYGKALYTVAPITMTQTVNGRFKVNSVIHSNTEGAFAMQLADAPFVMVVSAPGYQQLTVTDETMPENGVLFLTKIQGSRIHVTVPAFVSVQDLNFELHDLIYDEPIEGFELQDYDILLYSHLPDCEVRVTASSKSGQFMPVEAVASLTNGKASVDLPILPFGGIDATYAASGQENVVAMLYDAEGVFMKKQAFSAKEVTFDDLPDGSYTLVAMGLYAPLNQLENLAQFAQVGLQVNKDYAQKSFSVVSGQTTAVEFASVPKLDIERFNYTGKNTSFGANQHVVVVGNYVTLTAEIDFKEAYAAASNVQLEVEMPEGCKFVEGSVMIGSQVSSYLFEDNKLRVTLPENSGRVRFCAVPTKGGEYAMNAFVAFSYDEEQKNQAIGAATFHADDISINTPDFTCFQSIHVSGSAIGGSYVAIYDKGAIIGTLKVPASGQWLAEVDLLRPMDFSIHQISAVITTPDGIEMETETKQVIHNINAVELSQIHMKYVCAEEHKRYDMLFDQLYPSKKPNSYRFGHGNHTYEFSISFTKNDPEIIDNVELYVKTKNGSWHTLPAWYDDVHGNWYATGDFDGRDGNLPVNVDATFWLMSGEAVGTGRAFQSETENLKSFSQLMAFTFGWYSVNFDWLGDEDLGDEYHETYEMYDDTYDKKVQVRLEWFDYEESLKLFDHTPFKFTPLPAGFFCLYDDFKEDGYHGIVVNSEEKYAVRIHATRPGMTLSARRRAPKTGEASVEDILAAYSAQQGAVFRQGLDLYEGLVDVDAASEASGFKQHVELLSSYVKDAKAAQKKVEDAINAKNVKGQYLLSEEKRKEYQQHLQTILAQVETFQSKYVRFIDAYENTLEKASMFDVTMGLLAKANRPSTAGQRRAPMGGIVPETEEEYFKDFSGKTEYLTENAIENDAWTIFMETEDVIQPGDENHPIEETMEVIAKQQQEYIADMLEMEDDVVRSYPQDDEPAPSAIKPRGLINPDAKVSFDPAGYVYEGVSTNRIEGVKATVYYKEVTTNVFDEPVEREVRWDASEYDQENPLYTDENGYYQWFVPEGLWQVRYEKDGYEPTRSEWLPVPPPQLEVNIPMTQLRQPEVISAIAHKDAIDITFDKYMKPSLLTTENIFVMAEERVIAGTVTLLDEQESYGTGSATYATKVRFVPDEPFAGGEVTLTVSQRVRSYADVAMREAFQQVFDVEGAVEVPQAATPTASIETGSVITPATELTLSCETEGALIRYTTDGSEPDCLNGLLYGEGIKLYDEGEVTVKAIACADGFNPSEVAVFVYTVSSEPTALECVQPAVRVEKTMRDGMLLIQRGDKTYTVMGEEIVL
jgi:hypothetical protein